MIAVDNEEEGSNWQLKRSYKNHRSSQMKKSELPDTAEFLKDIGTLIVEVRTPESTLRLEMLPVYWPWTQDTTTLIPFTSSFKHCNINIIIVQMHLRSNPPSLRGRVEGVHCTVILNKDLSHECSEGNIEVFKLNLIQLIEDEVLWWIEILAMSFTVPLLLMNWNTSNVFYCPLAHQINEYCGTELWHMSQRCNYHSPDPGSSLYGILRWHVTLVYMMPYCFLQHHGKIVIQADCTLCSLLSWTKWSILG